MPLYVIVAFAIIMIVIIFLVASTAYFLDQAIFRKKEKFLVINPDLNNATTPWVPDNAWLASQPLEDVIIQSSNGLKLHLIIIKAYPS